MKLNGVEIEDTFAELFDVKVARILVTAYDYELAEIAAREATGFGTSIIMCPAEAGVEGKARPEETPDGRPGVYIQICHPSKRTLEQQLVARIGQCILTAPTANAFDGLPDAEERVDTGNKLRYFGDGFEKQVEIGGRKAWAIPIMEGDFIVENDFGVVEGIAGGNFFIMGENQPAALLAAKAAVDAISNVEHVITPFPGGIVASGSKVGAKKYKFLKATTNERFAPTLKGRIESDVPENVNAIYEIVINGLSIEAVKKAMKAGISAATKVPGIVKISAGNYGGKLGKHAVYLGELL